jgi:hypothetical protein
MSSLDNSWDPVEDTDNLNQKMQIRAINEARSKVRTVRNNAQEQIASAQGGSQNARAQAGGRRVYLEVVKSYALELAPLVYEHNTELWTQTKLLEGAWTYQPSEEDKEVVGIEPETVGVTVKGLSEFLQTEFPVTARFEVRFRDTAKGDEPEVRQESWLPSFSQTDIVLLQLDEARKSLGLFLEGPDEVGVESDEPV